MRARTSLLARLLLAPVGVAEATFPQAHPFVSRLFLPCVCVLMTLCVVAIALLIVEYTTTEPHARLLRQLQRFHVKSHLYCGQLRCDGAWLFMHPAIGVLHRLALLELMLRR